MNVRCAWRLMSFDLTVGSSCWARARSARLVAARLCIQRMCVASQIMKAAYDFGLGSVPVRTGVLPHPLRHVRQASQAARSRMLGDGPRAAPIAQALLLRRFASRDSSIPVAPAPRAIMGLAVLAPLRAGSETPSAQAEAGMLPQRVALRFADGALAVLVVPAVRDSGAPAPVLQAHPVPARWRSAPAPSLRPEALVPRAPVLACLPPVPLADGRRSRSRRLPAGPAPSCCGRSRVSLRVVRHSHVNLSARAVYCTRHLGVGRVPLSGVRLFGVSAGRDALSLRGKSRTLVLAASSEVMCGCPSCVLLSTSSRSALYAHDHLGVTGLRLRARLVVGALSVEWAAEHHRLEPLRLAG